MPYLSVIMPVYNERAHISEILRRVREVPVDKEIICVDDCSRDGTWDVLQQEGQTPGTRVFRHAVNGGKGAAVATGISKAEGQVLIIQDADLEYDPMDYVKLLQPIQAGTTKVVYGSRFLGTRQQMTLANAWGNRGLTLIANLLFGTHLTDMETCYKVFTADIAAKLHLQSQRWGIDPEITAKIIRMGHRIYELPISYTGRSFEEGKTIRWYHGFSVILTLLRLRFLP